MSHSRLWFQRENIPVLVSAYFSKVWYFSLVYSKLLL